MGSREDGKVRDTKIGAPPSPHHQIPGRQIRGRARDTIASNLANFAYNPYNYAFLRQLNVLELFIDFLMEPNERLVEFGVGSIYNAITTHENTKIVGECVGVSPLIECLLSQVKSTVKYAIGSLYYLLENNYCERRYILRTEVVELVQGYANTGSGDGFGNLVRVMLDKHCVESSLAYTKISQ